jgi:hypothetical protein
MTEDEAKKRTCHLSMATDEGCRCLGSRCMAWRWHALPEGKPFLAALESYIANNRNPGDPHAERSGALAHVRAYRAEFGLPTETTDGDCVLLESSR